MKNIILKGLSLVCTGLIFFTCNEKKEAPAMVAAAVDKDQIKKEIQAKEDAFAEIYNTGQMKSIGYYADDATSYFQNRAPLVGREAIVSFLIKDIISNTDRISFKTNDIFVSSDGNMVVEVGHYEVVDSVHKPINAGNYITLFEKRDGRYVAVRDMSASDGSVK